MMAPATSGTTVTPTGKPTPRSSRYSMTPQTDSSPKALPPERTTPCVVGARWRGSRNSIPYTPAARPEISTAPTAGRSGRIAVQPVSPTASVAWPTRRPGIMLLAARGGRPAHLGGLDAAEGDLSHEIESPRGHGPHEGEGLGGQRLVATRRCGGPGEGGGLPGRGGLEEQCH